MQKQILLNCSNRILCHNENSLGNKMGAGHSPKYEYKYYIRQYFDSV